MKKTGSTPKKRLEDMVNEENLKLRKPANYTYFRADNIDKENKIIVVPFSDIHYGNKYCKQKEFENNLNWAYRQKNVYLLLNGDLIESKTRSRKGDGIFTQVEPQEQFNYISEIFKPFADEGRIIATTNGNHEDAVKLETGMDISSMFAKYWGVPYLKNGGFIGIRVGDQTYNFYMTHGSSGATLPHTKSKAARDIGTFVQGIDAVLYGHVHALEDATQEIYYPDTRHRKVGTKTVHYVLTGHYLDYLNSYAQMKSMRPSQTGTPKLKMKGDEHDFRVSL